jgi:hypothetical protein
MRFKFGHSREQKAAIREAKKEWHVWYAWLPVRVGNGPWAWFEHVQRIAREGQTGMAEPAYLRYTYKELDPLMRFINKKESIK